MHKFQLKKTNRPVFSTELKAVSKFAKFAKFPFAVELDDDTTKAKINPLININTSKAKINSFINIGTTIAKTNSLMNIK